MAKFFFILISFIVFIAGVFGIATLIWFANWPAMSATVIGLIWGIIVVFSAMAVWDEVF